MGGGLCLRWVRLKVQPGFALAIACHAGCFNARSVPALKIRTSPPRHLTDARHSHEMHGSDDQGAPSPTISNEKKNFSAVRHAHQLHVRMRVVSAKGCLPPQLLW